MRELDPNDPNPPYRQLVRVVVDAITSGELKPGDRLPSQSELRQQYGLANMTIQRAMNVLRTQGRVLTRSGSGVYVRDPTNPDAASLDPMSRNQRINEILDRLYALRTRRTVLAELMGELNSDSDPVQHQAVFELATTALEETRSLLIELATFDFAAEADEARRSMDHWRKVPKPASDSGEASEQAVGLL